MTICLFAAPPPRLDRWRFGFLSVLAWLAATFSPHQALACGGCFSQAPTEENLSFVTSHRMAFSVSPERTVLWDQFSYSGDPEDFSWVLPVERGAYLEEAEQAWLDALDTVTTPAVYGQPASCNGGGSGCGCPLGGMAASDTDGAGYYESVPAVEVVSQSTIGPYDTVVLRSSDEQALQAWLGQNGYVVPPGIDAIIEAYVDEGFDFLALRLSPGKSVQQMTPVRVVTPGGSAKLPLRMVAAGIGSEVELTLFVLADSRRMIPDLLDTQVAEAELTWNYATDSSDYEEIVDAKLALDDGHVQLTTYAQRQPFTRLDYPPDSYGQSVTYQTDRGIARDLDELYFLQAASDAGFSYDCNTKERPHSSLSRVGSRCGEGPCPPLPLDEQRPENVPIGLGGGSSGDGQGGGGGDSEATDPSKPPTWSGHFVCRNWTDMEAAMIGHVPNEMWLTRLDMRLPVSALARDCDLRKSPNQNPVNRLLTAQKSKGDPCAGVGTNQASIVGSGPVPPWLLALLPVGMWINRRRHRMS